MLNEKQKVIQEKLEDIYRVVKFKDIEEVSVQVTGKILSRHKFLKNLVAYTMGYCHQLIEHYQLTSSEDFNVSFVLESLSNDETESVSGVEYLLEWSISKLAYALGLDPNKLKEVE
ncbi:hypothetical protein K2V62_06195 [Mammaliicoccus sciuri]|uniref:hypothetical protein n=1 Tax=Mammaliicoccus sciuri TaxID=1296 RepID=UPI001E4B60E6|nr:hypothetical protein [Mammaliicoccus sciuri]MCD8894286.1 hypothetical protein [Mammaliicoccus sciuri]MCD8912475.1 hypothetical protein [Mammaliicoccus sciuri]